MKAIVVLKMPRRFGDKLMKARGILVKLTGNTNFISIWPSNIVSLAQFEIDVQAFEDAEVAVTTGLVGTVATRDEALRTVMADLRGIKTMVQSVADKYPANALDIIQGAGYAAKKASSKPKLQNDAFNTEVLGTVLLTGEGGEAMNGK